MKRKALQTFSKDRLQARERLSPLQIAKFLDEFRKLYGGKGPQKVVPSKLEQKDDPPSASMP